MLLSEEEAKLRWCPLSRSVGLVTLGSQQGVVSGWNRDHPSGNIPACIASSCMAWRWGEPKVLRDIDLVTSDVVDATPRRGYCGAFGSPSQED